MRDVAVLALEGGHAFELGVFREAFGIDRSDDALPVYDFAVVSASSDSVPTRHGFHVQTPHGLERLGSADLICIPARDPGVRQPPELFEALRAAVEHGARVLSICTGAFLLGEAGLLDGRRCTTHWRYTDELARRYPPVPGFSRTCCMSTRTRSSPVPVLTPASTWSARNTAAPSPTRSPGAWSRLRTAKVTNANTASDLTPGRAPAPSPHCWPGSKPTSTRN